jgi:hypothetical protein
MAAHSTPPSNRIRRHLVSAAGWGISSLYTLFGSAASCAFVTIDGLAVKKNMQNFPLGLKKTSPIRL